MIKCKDCKNWQSKHCIILQENLSFEIDDPFCIVVSVQTPEDFGCVWGEMRHLTSRRSRAAYDCEKSGHIYHWQDGICIYCDALKPPPA